LNTAIYTRYSSDLQSERSIEDQVALARAYALREGLTIVTTYEDRAMSGASTAQRHGLMNLLADAAAGRFKVLVVESLDRLSRDQADMATLYKRLRFHGIEVREVHGGIATPMNAAVRGLMGTLFLVDLAAKTHRGMAGNIREGKSAGGRAYGYAPVPGQPGRLVIVEHEAEVVRQIFAQYAAGDSPRKIAAKLNENNVPPILGQRWNASTIQGRKDRGNGILGNALYSGEMVWNKVKMLKHPDTGRRISRANPPAEWQRKPVPDLAIIDAETWAAAQARRTVYDPRGHTTRQPRYLLSGLLKCHCCGSTLVIKGRKGNVVRIECSAHKESGTCANNRTYNLTRIEAAILDSLKCELADPQLIEAYVREYNATRRELARSAEGTRHKTERRLAAVTGELERTVTLMIKGLVDPERHAPRVKELEIEEKQLRAELARQPMAEVITLHPQAITRYREDMECLSQCLAAGTPEAAMLRRLVKRIVVQPDYTFNIEGRLSELINLPGLSGPKGGIVVVAGEGVGQYPTFWLAGRAA
jgi:site-specific DNA recombinase